MARLSKCPHNRGGGRCANSMRTQEAERYMSAPFFVVFRFQATGTSIVPIAWIVSQIRDGLNGPLLTPFSSFDLVPFAHQTHGVNAPVSMPPRLPSTSSLGLVPIGYSCAFWNIFVLLFVISYTYVRGRVIPPARLDEHSLTSESSIDVLPDIPVPDPINRTTHSRLDLGQLSPDHHTLSSAPSLILQVRTPRLHCRDSYRRLASPTFPANRSFPH